MPGQAVLLVEDDPAVSAVVRSGLGPAGYELLHAGNCADGWRIFEAARPSLAVLDVGLPDGSGVELCRRIRSHPDLAPTPVILLTAKGEIEDKVGGFEAGADHYLVKPFQVDELRFWAEALLRRIRFAEEEGGVLRNEDFVVDPAAHTVTAGDRVIRDLTRKEFDLLYELVRRRPRVLSKEFILSALWNSVLRDNTVEVHIRNLRLKLGPAAERVITVPGQGYRFW